MEHRDENLKKEVESLSREVIIEWLQWNDQNGIYNDRESIREFGRKMCKSEGVEIMIRQIKENQTVVSDN